MANFIKENVLAYIWTQGSDYIQISKEDIIEKFGIETAKKSFEDMDNSGSIDIIDQRITLTTAGMKEAEQIIRRHRLAERLFFDVLDPNPAKYESSTCNFELYSVPEEIITGICTLLGHPPICPHGKIIPQAKCCIKAGKKVESLISPISRLSPGTRCEIVYFDRKFDVPLYKTSGITMEPGTQIHVHEIDPTFIIQIDETNITIDKNIAEQIFVRQRQY